METPLSVQGKCHYKLATKLSRKEFEPNVDNSNSYLFLHIMSTGTIGEELRNIREGKELQLRKVAALLNIDAAILSKMERGGRRITKEIVLKFADVYKYDADVLFVSFSRDRIIYEIMDENSGIEASKEVEEKVKYINATKQK